MKQFQVEDAENRQHCRSGYTLVCNPAHMLQSPGSMVTHVVQSLSSSDSLQPHGLQHTRLWVCSNSCPLSWWCHPTISPSVVPISSCLQSFPPLGSFPLSQLFASCGQIVGSFSISPSSEYSGLIFFRIDWFYLLAIQGTAVALAVKKLPANAGDLRDKGLIPGSGRSLGGGHGNPLQYYCLENSMDRGAWWATQSMGLQRVGHDWSDLAHMHGSFQNSDIWVSAAEILMTLIWASAVQILSAILTCKLGFENHHLNRNSLRDGTCDEFS